MCYPPSRSILTTCLKVEISKLASDLQVDILVNNAGFVVGVPTVAETVTQVGRLVVWAWHLLEHLLLLLFSKV